MRSWISNIDTDTLYIHTHTFTFYCCSLCCRFYHCCYGNCVDILTLIAFCISHYFIVYVVTSSVEARLLMGFSSAFIEVFPLAHCVGPQVPKFSVVLRFFDYAFWPLAVSSTVHHVLLVHLLNSCTCLMLINSSCSIDLCQGVMIHIKLTNYYQYFNSTIVYTQTSLHVSSSDFM